MLVERHFFKAKHGDQEAVWWIDLTVEQKTHLQDEVYEAWVDRLKIEAREKLWVMLSRG